MGKDCSDKSIYSINVMMKNGNGAMFTNAQVIKNLMDQYEREYRQTVMDAVKAVDANWEIGKPIKSSDLDSISRESVEANLDKSGSSFG